MDAEVKAWLNKGSYLDYRGQKTFYVEEGTGEPLLIIHGYPYSSFEWKWLWPMLTSTYRVVTFDLLGMGFSDKPKDYRYSFEEYAEIVNQLLSQLNIESVHIFSHDLGVSVAQELLARGQTNQFNIKSIAYINGGLFMDAYHPRLIQKLLSQSPPIIGKLLNKMLSRKMIEKSVKNLFGPRTQPEDAFMEQQWQVLNYNEGKDIAYLLGRLVFDKVHYQTRWISAMQSTTVPMCYIHGPNDPNSGLHMANRYKKLIPNPKVYSLERHIGHWPNVEAPDELLKAYLTFRIKILT